MGCSVAPARVARSTLTDRSSTSLAMKNHRPLRVVIKLGEIHFHNKIIHDEIFHAKLTIETPGTSSIVDEKTHEPILSILSLIVETAVKLRQDGYKVIIVSSGAIGVGLQRMEVEKKPKHLSKLQVMPTGWTHRHRGPNYLTQ